MLGENELEIVILGLLVSKKIEKGGMHFCAKKRLSAKRLLIACRKPTQLNPMKHLRLVLTLSLVAFLATFTLAAADTFDSDSATIQKASDTSAKVLVGSKTYTAPISFADGASWDTVKDHYEVADSVVAGLGAGKIAISIGSDGTATFTTTK